MTEAISIDRELPGRRWPVGDDVMSMAVRHRDWSQTALGPIAEWPAELRFATAFVLDHPLPTCLIWKSTRATLFNAAFQLAFKANAALLGRPFVEVCPEAWLSMAASVDRCFAGKAGELDIPTWLDRSVDGPFPGHALASLTPIRSDRGDVLGVVARFMLGASASCCYRTGELCEPFSFLTDQADAEVVRSRDDLDRAQAVAHVGSWRLMVRRNELAWSRESFRIFGVPEGAPLTYETFLSFVHPDDRDYVDRCWKAALQGSPYDIEHRLIVDGRVKWVRERAELEFDEAGRLLGGFGTCQDISDRKSAEQELNDSKNRLSQLGDNLPDSAIFQYARGADDKPRFIYVSHGIERLNGVRCDDVLRDGDVLHGQIDDRHRSLLIAAETKSARDMTDFVLDVPMKRPDGERRWMRLRSRPRRQPDGSIVWDGVQTDVTERKRIEGALIESESRLSLFIENVPAAIAMFDTDMTYLAVSRRMLSEYLSGRGDVIGLNHYQVFPECPERWRLAHERALAGEVVRAEAESWTLSDGRTLWARYEVRPWYKQDGSIGGIILFTEDITERRLAEEAS